MTANNFCMLRTDTWRFGGIPAVCQGLCQHFHGPEHHNRAVEIAPVRLFRKALGAGEDHRAQQCKLGCACFAVNVSR